MVKSVDQNVMKAINRSLTLDLVRFHGPLSRTQIAKETGLNKATITAVIAELMAQGYVKEIGRGHSYAGRRPVLLQFEAGAGLVLGVDIGVAVIQCALTDLAARTVVQKTAAMPPDTQVSDVLDVCVTIIDACLAQVHGARERLRGVGVAVPGLVDYRAGVVLNAPNLGWRNVPLGSLLADRLRLPVSVDNEANIGALAEMRYGHATLLTDFIYISAGMGIGTGIVVGGQLLRGVSGIAGEYGHTIIDLQGPRCRCGNRGCLEVYASLRALLDRYAKNAGRQVDFLTFRQALEKGDEAALESVQTVAGYLAIGILHMLHAQNPSAIIIGNDLGKISDWLIQTIVPFLQAHSLTATHEPIDIRQSALGDQAGVTGAAALAIDQHFQSMTSASS